MQSIFDEIKAERERQDAKFGGADHDDTHSVFHWFGVVRQYVIKAERDYDYPKFGAVRRRLIQVAALAVAAVEVIDRRAGK